ncbi:MAG: YihY/virulence factor BrkB family protein [Gemmatimonadaceae bacterium]
MIIKGYRVGPLLKGTAREIVDDGVPDLAAETAYYFFFSLFPILLFIAPMLSIVGDKRQVIDVIMRQLQGAVPPEAMALVQGVLRDVVFSSSAPGVMSVGALLALWAGSNIFNALMAALNVAYDVEETRPWWKRKLVAIAAVIGAGFAFALATTIFLAGEDIVSFVANLLGIGQTGRIAWTVIQLALAVAIVVGLAWATFLVLPNVKQNRKQALVGALVTTVLWIVVTLAFRFYVQHFGSYNKTYGAIGAVIVLLTWMYLSMLTLLIGGELNSELQHGTGAVAPHRGATLAGRVATGAGRPTSTEWVEHAAPFGAKGRE